MSRVARSVGQFVWNTRTGEWHWDRGMFEVHGYRDGAVAVSTDLVVQHKAVEHRARAVSMLDASAGRDQRFSNHHGIVDATGRHRTVLVVGESRSDTSRPGPARRLSTGFMVDVTQDQNASIKRALRQAQKSTAVIQQSTGLLMGSLGLTEEAAFAVMLRLSHHHNVKLRDLARRFMSAAAESAADTPRDLTQILVSQAAALAVQRAREAPR